MPHFEWFSPWAIVEKGGRKLNFFQIYPFFSFSRLMNPLFVVTAGDLSHLSICLKPFNSFPRFRFAAENNLVKSGNRDGFDFRYDFWHLDPRLIRKLWLRPLSYFGNEKLWRWWTRGKFGSSTTRNLDFKFTKISTLFSDKLRDEWWVPPEELHPMVFEWGEKTGIISWISWTEKGYF